MIFLNGKYLAHSPTLVLKAIASCLEGHGYTVRLFEDIKTLVLFSPDY